MSQEKPKSSEKRVDKRAMYDQYVAQQPQSIQAAHRWLTRLCAASLGLPLGMFVWALYISFYPQTVDPLQITFWWVATFTVGGLPFILFQGLDCIMLGAVHPVFEVRGKASEELVTGRAALLMGLGVILVGLAWAAIWIVPAYGFVANGLGGLERLITIPVNVISVVVAAIVIISIFQRLVGSRTLAGGAQEVSDG